MGWNVSILHISAPGPDAGGALTLGPERRVDPAGDRIDAWALTLDTGVVVVSQSFRPSAVDALASTGVRLTQVVIGSTGGAYCLELYSGGELIRRLVRTDTGEYDVDEGRPLPGETEVDEEFTEDRFFMLFCAVTGIDDLMFLTEAEFNRVVSPRLV